MSKEKFNSEKDRADDAARTIIQTHLFSLLLGGGSAGLATALVIDAFNIAVPLSGYAMLLAVTTGYLLARPFVKNCIASGRKEDEPNLSCA